MASLNVQRAAGGGAGLGGTLAARQFLDEPGQTRLRQPSVLFGLGTGLLGAALWYTDIDTPVVDDDFWISHAMTSVPTAAFFAAFPKQSGKTTVQQVQEALGGAMGGNGGGSAPARERVGAASVETGSAGRRR